MSFRTLLICLGVLWTAYYYLGPSPSVADISLSGQRAEITEGGDVTARMSLGRETSMRRKIFHLKEQGSGFGGAILHASGIRYQMGTLSDSKYQEFESITQRGGCAASFLNNNAEMLLIVPSSKAVDSTIKRLKSGDTVHLSGYPINEILSFQRGQEIPLTFPGAQPFLVTNARY